jgi:hypothetical protein
MPAFTLDFLAESLDPRVTFTRASGGGRWNAQGQYEWLADGAPRFDYDPITLAPRGLLVEEQRTNLALWSGQINRGAGTPWFFGANNADAASAIPAPDGTMTATTLTISGPDNGVYQNIAVSPGVAYTQSWFVRLGTLSVADFKIAVYNNTTPGFINADIVPSVAPRGDRWTRIDYTFTPPAGCTSVRVYLFRSGTGSGTLHVWGAQLELGAFATSYIPTAGAQATRAADVATVNTLAPWFNAVEGTLMVEFSQPARAAGCVAQIGKVSGSGWHAIFTSTADNAVRQITRDDTNAAVTAFYAGNWAADAIVKSAVGMKANDFYFAVNGSGSADTSAVMPTGIDILRIGHGTTFAPLNGHSRSLKFYPARLPNATLQSFTV